MEQLLDQLKEWIVASVGSWGYLAVFVLMALESACIPIPSEVTMPVAGLLAHEGKLSFFWAGFLGAVANLAGSWAAYGIGRGGGRSLLLKYGRYILIKPHDIERADRWFERYGDRAVFFTRLLPVVRTFISLPAGVARMPFWRFSVLTLIGCIPWSFALTAAGYVLGDNWERILPYIEPLSYLIAAVLAIMVGVWWMRRVRAAREASTTGQRH
ncbi:MAG: DedA family protein [Actinomycetota bacterium]|nr:DedA family protein [Actinomycetota bacterium]